MIFTFLIGLLAGIAIAFLAYQARALNRSGAVAAAVMGAVIFGLGGLPWAMLLLTFFISSSALSKAFSSRKKAVDEKYSKGSRRDAGQVLANGGVAGALVLVYLLVGRWLPDSPYPGWVWLAFTASLAAANADTWATELGVLSPSLPVMITSGKPVERGTSGGVSLVGSLSALAGSALISGLAWAMQAAGWAPSALASIHISNLWLFVLVMAVGMVGSLIDSVLGATVQAIYDCPTCHKETERHPLHTCGAATTLKRGWPWLNNDWVNTACTVSAACLLLIAGLIPGAAPAAAVQGGTPMSMSLVISAFANGGTIPKDYTCDGANHSPEINWSGAPAGTRSLALIVDDPDAPVGTFTHWVLFNLPPAQTQLAAGQPRTAALAGGGLQGLNDFGHTYFDGPCPPAGNAHRYFFRIYAMDSSSNLPAGSSVTSLRKAMQGHILAQGDYIGKYGR